MRDYDETYKGLVPRDPGELDRGTMSTEELKALQGEHGEIYRGMAPRDPGELDRGTMSTEELKAWQGEHGEIYRGMAPRDPGELDRGTMSREEFINWQGKHGEIYRGMVPEDPDKYRLESTGTTNPAIANLVTEFSQLDPADAESVKKIVEQLLQEPSCISKFMERRIRKTADFLYDYGDYNLGKISADMAILTELMVQGYDFTTFKVDLSTQLGEKENIADFNKFIEYYKMGIERAKANGKNTMVQNQLQPGQQVYAEQVLQVLQTYYQDMLKNAPLTQDAPKIDM